MKNFKKQLGYTLLELIIAIPIITIASTVAIKAYRNYVQTQDAYEYGTALVPVVNTVQTYAQTYWQNLQGNTSITLTDGTTVADIYAPTTAELKKLSTGALASWYNPSNNIMNAMPVVSLSLSPVGCAAVNAANCDIQGVVYWDKPYTGVDGKASVHRASQAASQIPAGGFSSYDLPASITALDNGWTIANPLNVPGVVGSFFSANSSGNQIYVKVGDNRDPALRGNLTVDGTASANALTVATTGTVGKLQLTNSVVERAVCTPNGLVSKDSTGLLLSCQGGFWKSVGSKISTTAINGFIPTYQTLSGCSGAPGYLTVTEPGFYSINVDANAYRYSGSYVNFYVSLLDPLGTTVCTAASNLPAGGGTGYFSPNGTCVEHLSAGTHTVQVGGSDASACGTSSLYMVFTGSAKLRLLRPD